MSNVTRLTPFGSYTTVSSGKYATLATLVDPLVESGVLERISVTLTPVPTHPGCCTSSSNIYARFAVISLALACPITSQFPGAQSTYRFVRARMVTS